MRALSVRALRGAAALVFAVGIVGGAMAQGGQTKAGPKPTQPPVILKPTGPIAKTAPVQTGQDRDGDGHATPQDCDDGDASRFPGNTETANDRDEDCNPTTIGERDADYDGFVDFRVSNAASYGPDATAGLDCDDSQGGIRPDAQELPNRLDDNCDGRIDNLLGTWWTPK